MTEEISEEELKLMQWVAETPVEEQGDQYEEQLREIVGKLLKQEGYPSNRMNRIINWATGSPIKDLGVHYETFNRELRSYVEESLRRDQKLNKNYSQQL